MNPNAFPESCRESDKSDCQSRARNSIVEDVSWQFEQIIMFHRRSITHEDTRTIEDMFFYIFYRHLGVRRRDRSPNRPRLRLQGKLLENKLLRDQGEREARVLNGLKQRLAMRTKSGNLSEQSIEIIRKAMIPDETVGISKPSVSVQSQNACLGPQTGMSPGEKIRLIHCSGSSTSTCPCSMVKEKNALSKDSN